MGAPPASSHPLSPLRTLIALPLLAAAYVLLAQLSLQLAVVEGNVAPVWLPTGLGVAVLLGGGLRLWPGLFAGALIAVLRSGAPATAAAAVAAGNTLESVLAVWLLLRVPGLRAGLDRLGDVVALLLATAVGSVVSAGTGVAALILTGALGNADPLVAGRVWWLGDWFGGLLVAPLLLSWNAPDEPDRPPGRPLEAVGLAILLGGAAAFAFTRAYGVSAIYPLVVWAALRFEMRGATAATALIAAFAVWGLVVGNPPFAGGTAGSGVLRLQLIIGASALLGLVTAAVTAERRRAVLRLREAHEFQRAVVESSPLAVAVLDLQGRVRGWNPAAGRLFGYAADEVMGREPPFVPPGHAAEWRRTLARFPGVERPVEAVRVRRDGTRIDVRLSIAPLRAEDGSIVGSVRMFEDVTAQKRIENVLRDVARVVSGLTGEAFFRSLVEQIAGALDADVAAVAELTGPGRERARTIAFYADGAIREDIEYPLAGTPCADLSQPELCVVPQDARSRFPDDPLLAQWDVEGYMGSPLVDSEGQPIGLLTVLSRRPVGDAELARALLQLFASRAAAELERRTTEQALRASEARYRTLFEQSPVGIFVFDAERRLTAANPALGHILGSTPEALVGLHAGELKDRRILPAIEQALAGQPARYEGPYEATRSRAAIWLTLQAAPQRDEQGRVIGGLGLVDDITEQRRTAEMLRWSEQRLAALAEATEDAVYDWDVASGRIWWGAGLNRLFGYDADHFTRQREAWLAGLHPEDRDRLVSRVRQAIADDTRTMLEEFRFRRADGSWVPVLARGEIQRDGSGRAVRVLGALTDLSERKAAEEALRHTEEQLRQAQKMEAVGRLAGGVAHDFNNLLTTILGFADLVLQELPASDRHRADVEEIRAAAQRAAGLTRQLLAFSRRQVVEPQLIELNGVVEGIGTMLRRLIGEDVRLEQRLEPRPAWIRADPGQLEQVLVNLAVNARDAMPHGGTLTIETARTVLDVAAAAELELAAGAYVRLTVRDTGVGMDEATQSRIFEPFFTTKEPGRGTGLGLSMVYGFVAQSGGRVTVASRPNAGTSFSIYLPELAESGVPLAEPAPVRIRGGSETILLVEDEEVVRELARRVLAGQGYQVLVASTPDEALARARQHEGPIHLLLTDVIMPGMSGPRLAELLLPGRPEARVLFMSGYTDNAIVQADVVERGIAFLQKPFLPELLARRVREVLDAPAVA